jgi:predicted PurR-regulated permease PerM
VAIDTDTQTEPAPAPRVIAQIGTPSLRGVARLVGIVAACAGALYLLYLTRGVVKILVIALFTAVALGPVVDAVQRTRLPRAWAILAVYAACLIAVLGLGALAVPSIGSEVGQLSTRAEHAVGDLRGNPTVRRYDARYHITEKVQAQLKTLPSHVSDAAGPLRDATVGVFGLISNAVAVLTIAFLLILHGDRYWHGVLSLLPGPHAERWRRVAPQIYRAVSAYVIGNLEISAIAGACAWVAMTALGIPFALPLALAIGFFDLIPMVGATLGAIIVGLVALLVSPLTAVIWFVYAFAYQQAENYLIQPLVYRRAVQVSALTTIVAVLVGATLLGLLGALLAIPAAAAVQLVFEDLRRER